MHHVHNDNHTDQIIGTGDHTETMSKPLGDYAAQQPCSGTKMVITMTSGTGMSAASPAYVCMVKTAA